MAGEIEDPQVIPKATLITVPLIMAVYIFPTLGGLASLGSWSQWSSEGGITYADVVAQHVPALGVVFVLIAVLAQFSLFNAYITSGSRGFFALAADNLAPQALVRCSEDRGVPYIAVLSLGAFSLVASTFPFEVIVVVDVMLFISAYVLIFISACILRIREPDLERPFRAPFGTAGFIAMCIPPVAIAVLALFISGADYFLGGLLALASGPAAYVFFRRRYGGLSKVDPRDRPGRRRHEETGAHVRLPDGRRRRRHVLPALVRGPANVRGQLRNRGFVRAAHDRDSLVDRGFRRTCGHAADDRETGRTGIGQHPVDEREYRTVGRQRSAIEMWNTPRISRRRNRK